MSVKGILKGKYHCTVGLRFDWFGMSYMTSDNFCFYLQNRLIQTSQTGGQWYSDTLYYSLVCLSIRLSISLPVDRIICLSVYRPICVSYGGSAGLSQPSLVCFRRWNHYVRTVFTRLFVRPFVGPSAYQSIWPSVCPSRCLFFHLEQETLTEVRGRVQLTSLLS
jgi:hypothetical protein